MRSVSPSFKGLKNDLINAECARQCLRGLEVKETWTSIVFVSNRLQIIDDIGQRTEQLILGSGQLKRDYLILSNPDLSCGLDIWTVCV